MRIYQLQTAAEFLETIKNIKEDYSIEVIMQIYAEDVAKKFAAECVNEALGNKMEVSSALHNMINRKYNSIIWNNEVCKV